MSNCLQVRWQKPRLSERLGEGPDRFRDDPLLPSGETRPGGILDVEVKDEGRAAVSVGALFE